MSRRVVAFVALFASVLAMLVLGSDADRPDAVIDDGRLDGFGLPLAAPSSATSSTWFCAGGTGTPADDTPFADHTVIVANPSEAAVRGAITVYAGTVREAPSAEEQLQTTTTSTTAVDADDGDGDDEGTGDETTNGPVTDSIEIGPFDRIEVRLGDLLEGDLVSAIVELEGSDGVVEHRVESINGVDVAPCASSAATEWHFAWGRTTDDSRELLVFFNPFPDDAVVDGFFITDDGPREPGRFDGLVVPARSVVGYDLGDDVTIREQVAGSLRLRSGRVVVDRILRRDGSDGPRGLTVRAGSPVPKKVWIFPDGLVDEGVAETLHLYNPTESSAEVLVDVLPDDPVENGIPEPFEVSVQPGAQVTLDLGADDRIVPGVAHSLVVRVLNNGAVVAERVLTVSSPAERAGLSVTAGSPVAATAWVFAGGGTSDAQDQFLYLVNPSNEFLTTFSVSALASGQLLAVQDLTDVELPAAGRVAIRLGTLIERDAAFVVTADLPVVVERGIYLAEGPGVSNAIGIPLRADLVEPQPLLTSDGDGG